MYGLVTYKIRSLNTSELYLGFVYYQVILVVGHP